MTEIIIHITNVFIVLIICLTVFAIIQCVVDSGLLHEIVKIQNNKDNDDK